MKDMLKKLSELQNADTTKTNINEAANAFDWKNKPADSVGQKSANIKHKGTYGTEYQGDTDDLAAISKKKKAAAATTEKRGRGRPPKTDSGEGDSKKYANAAALQSFMIGNKPSKAVEKLPKTKSNRTLKDWIESYEPAINEATLPGALTATPMAGATAIKNAQGQQVATAATPQAAAMMTKGDVTLTDPTKTLGEEATGKTARIFFNKDLGEYTVKFYQNGKHMADADYFTDDKEDARGTAKAETAAKEEEVDEATGRGKWDSNSSDYEGDYGGAENWGKREREDDEGYARTKDADDEFNRTLARTRPQGQKTNEAKKAKPDFLDVDKDGNKKESFKKAVKDKEAKPVEEAKKPSAGMTKGEKSSVVKKAKAGEDIGKPGKGFAKVEKAAAKSGAKDPKAVAAAAMWKGQAKKVSESKMSELDAALKDKNYSEADFKKQYGKTKADMRAAMKDKPEAKKPVKESKIMESADTLAHIINTFKHEVKNFVAGDDLDSDLFDALYDYYANSGEMPYGTMKARDGDPYEWVSDRFNNDVHDHIEPELDEGSKEDFTTHGMDSKPSRFIAVPAKPTQTPWSKDPIAAMTDRIYDKFASKPKNPQFESWSTQLDSLLNEDITEGMTVSISKGQQGSPDSVSINASDADAEQLLSLVKSAGLGLFGGDDEGQSTGGMSMPSTVTSSGPADVEVVDDHDGMLSLIRKMTGQAEPESSEDYADEESVEHEHGTEEEVCGDCGSSECECGAEEVVDETETENQREFEVSEDDNVAQAGAEESSEDSALAAADGQTQSAQEEEPEEEEELDEAYANSDDDKFQTDIDFMTNIITGGLNGKKRTQSVGNPVTIASTPMKESSDLLSDFKKLSGL